MPIEIRELQIKVTVDQPAGAGASPATAPDKHGEENEKLIRQCVEEMLRVLNDKKER